MVRWKRDNLVGPGDFAARLAKHLHRNRMDRPQAAARAADYYRIPRAAMADILGAQWECSYV